MWAVWSGVNVVMQASAAYPWDSKSAVWDGGVSHRLLVGPASRHISTAAGPAAAGSAQGAHHVVADGICASLPWRPVGAAVGRLAVVVGLRLLGSVVDAIIRLRAAILSCTGARCEVRPQQCCILPSNGTV